jgi:hypothetical protein
LGVASPSFFLPTFTSNLSSASTVGIGGMSSIQLPKVLQNRKTSLELEREHFEKFQVCFAADRSHEFSLTAVCLDAGRCPIA